MWAVVWGQGEGGPGRTDTEDYQENHEGVHHGKNRSSHCRSHLLERVYPSEEPYDTKGAHKLDEPVGNA